MSEYLLVNIKSLMWIANKLEFFTIRIYGNDRDGKEKEKTVSSSSF